MIRSLYSVTCLQVAPVGAFTTVNKYGNFKIRMHASVLFIFNGRSKFLFLKKKRLFYKQKMVSSHSIDADHRRKSDYRVKAGYDKFFSICLHQTQCLLSLLGYFSQFSAWNSFGKNPQIHRKIKIKWQI